jgi:hypothetical protein
MAKQSNQMRWIIGIGAVVLLAVLVRSSLQQTHAEYEVCMTFRGATHCSSATGSNYNEAVRSAEEIDCQLLAVGRDQTMVCLDTQPSSVRELTK